MLAQTNTSAAPQRSTPPEALRAAHATANGGEVQECGKILLGISWISRLLTLLSMQSSQPMQSCREDISCTNGSKWTARFFSTRLG